MFSGMRGYLVLFLFISISEAAPADRQPRQSPFSRMGGGAGGGPFHGPMGGMMGPMGGMGAMGPSMGGPTMGRQSHGSAGAMMTSVGLQCVRHEIVCPKWCLAEDANGCKSCPCGPAGGMNLLAGGPSGGPMGGAMSTGPMGGAMSMGSGSSGGYVGGSIGGGGGGVGGGVSGGGTGGSVSGGGGGGGAPSGGGYHVSSGGVASSHSTSSYTQTYVETKPVKECAATLLCASTCEGYRLGGESSGGCRSCSCPTSHHVSTTTIQYIIETVQPAQKECTVTAYCMRSCDGGYVMSKTDGYGCPECSCLQVEKPYQLPVEIAVEPPVDNYQPPIEYAVEPPVYQQTYALTCAAHSCNAGCTVGYKCGTDGCPTCECIHPTVVGLTNVQQVYIEQPLRCRNTFACPSSCNVGYKCGADGCPTCECVIATTTYTNPRPQYTAQTCTHTLTCAATCTNGYDLFTDGTSSCTKCSCKQQVVYETRPQVYAEQRPQPQYAIIDCPSTDSCYSQCPHGYTVIRAEGSCPKCQCKQAPTYAVVTSNSGCDNCHESYYTSGSSSGQSYVLVSGSSGTSYGGTGYVTSGGGSSGGGTGYVVSGGGGAGGGASYTRGSSLGGLAAYGSGECAPLPPDCQPSCIKYDTPHCRRCICETSYVRFAQS